jgi:tetratricopeptide (TPR) repeat protein
MGGTGFEYFDLCTRASRVGYELRVARDVFVHQNVRLPVESSTPQAVERDLAAFRNKWGIRSDSAVGQGLAFPKTSPKQAMFLVRPPAVDATHTYDDALRQWEEAGRLGVAMVVSDSSDRLWPTLARNTSPTSPLQMSVGERSPALEQAISWREGAKWTFATSELGVIERLNAALRASGDEPVVLISSGIEVPAGWLERLTQALASDPCIAVAGPLAIGAPTPQRPMDGDASEETLREVHYLGGFLLVFARNACRDVGPLSAMMSLENALWDYFARLRAADRRLVAVPTVRVDLAALTPEQGASFDMLWEKESALDGILAASQSAPDTGTAMRHLESLVAAFPDVARSRQAMGLAHLAMGNFRGAISELRAALERSPADPKLYNQLGYALAENGDMFAAETNFRSALELVPNQVDALFSLIELYRRRREFDGAQTMVDRLTLAAPANPDVIATRAMVALERGDRETARASLARLRELNPDHPALAALTANATAA